MNDVFVSVAIALLCVIIFWNSIISEILLKRIDKLEFELTKLKIRTECIRSEMHMKIDEIAIEQIKGE